MDPLIDRAALGVTELLSNVHRHARPDKSCTVELELLADRLTVSVRDHDPRLPVPNEPPPAGTADAAPPVAPADTGDPADVTPLATCGRGLAMVAAVSESWGARPDGENGKVVWFTLPAPPVTHSHPTGPPRSAVRPAPAPVTVTAAAGAPAPVPARTAVPSGPSRPARTPVGAGAPANTAVPVGAVTAVAGAGVPAGAGAAVAGAGDSPGPVDGVSPVGAAEPVAAAAPAPASAPAPGVEPTGATGTRAPVRTAVPG